MRATISCMLTLFSSLLFIHCGNSPKAEPESKVDYTSLIKGNWLLKKAYRDRKESVGLENTFFEFNGAGAMTSNFNMDGKIDKYSYTLEQDVIKQEGAENFVYHIYEISDSSLTLETQYRGFDFKLIMEKWTKNSQN